MDGLSVKFSGEIIGSYFKRDKYGMLIPQADMLDLEGVQRGMSRQLKSKTGLLRNMTDRAYSTDVAFTDNPDGNSPVIGFMLRDAGPRPWKPKRSEREQLGYGVIPDNIKARLAKRSEVFKKYSKSLNDLLDSLEPEDKDSGEHLLFEVEKDQVLTGGGFDNNKIGEVHLSGMKFVSKANSLESREDSVLSPLFVEGCMWLRDLIESSGIRPGSLSPMGATKVKMEQEKDGMLGYPFYVKSMNPLTKSIATRALIEYGVDTRRFVGTDVVDKTTGKVYKYRVIDAIAYILDSSIFTPKKLRSIVTLLARIQKAGYIMEDGELIKKPGKTRSVYPNAAVPSVLEAMVAQPFLDALQSHQVVFMPSLQTKAVRVEQIVGMLKNGAAKGGDYLSADWSQYDATINGADLATFVDLVMKPFYKSEYHLWVDYMNYIINFKYLIFDTDISMRNPAAYQDMLQKSQYFTHGPFTVVGMVHGLISGLKLTHVGGSGVGKVNIHFVIPKLLNYEPVVGAQAGDDTLMFYPRDRIDFSSMEKTFEPVAKAAKQIGYDMNVAKQIFHNKRGELVKVFLQENFHLECGLHGVGTIFRPLSAVATAERDKGLSIAEQFVAEISRMNQGADSPFVEAAVEHWLNNEQFIGILFKDYGESAFKIIIDSIGLDTKELAQRVDVGSFTWSLGLNDLATGKLDILPVIARVAKRMSFSETSSSVLKKLEVNSREQFGAIEEPEGYEEVGFEDDD